MWILKNYKDMLECINSRSLSSCNIITTFDFSTLYTTILHSAEGHIKGVGTTVFHKNNDQLTYKYIVLGRDISYLVTHHSDHCVYRDKLLLLCNQCFTKTVINT